MSNKQHSNTICFFDFDGTITDRDSLPDFIQYVVGKPAYYFGLLIISPMLLCYVLKLIPNHVAKQKLISHFFKDRDANTFQSIANQYSHERIGEILRPAAIERIKWHQQQQHKVVLVSASMQSWLQAWCNELDIELISTQLEIDNGRLSGLFATKNCHGQEKANRIRQQFNLEDYDYIYAYGDSSGDTEMLALANESQYKPFRD